MKFLQFDPESEGKKVNVTDIPEEFQDDAFLYREQMLESLYEFDDELAVAAMEEREISSDEIRRALRAGCLGMHIQPVFCGSALHGIGVNPLMDGVGHYLPSPLDRPPVVGTEGHESEHSVTRKPETKEPFSALVFKILPAKTGDNYWIRVYSGVLKSNSRVYCPNRDKKENVAQLWQIHASKKERDGQIDEVPAGEICCVIGPRFAITGDTLCDTREIIELPSIKFAQTVLSMAIEPESTADRKKLSETLEMLKRQDPTFAAVENEETGQTLISGMGELHLEVIQHRLTRDFGLKVKFYKPRVNYRETVGGKASVVGQCNRQIGAQQMYARLNVTVQPLEDPSAPVLVFDRIGPETNIPNGPRTAAMEELRERAHGGGLLAGFPLTGVRIDVTGGEAHEEGSDEIAFRIAAGDAFDRAMQEAGPTLLEPVMRVEITTPDEYMGDIVGDLQQRRGMIAKTENRGVMTTIVANAPLKELFGYSGAIRSLSQGRASSSMEPYGYQPAPPEDAEAFTY